jgi:hypothetical protein
MALATDDRLRRLDDDSVGDGGASDAATTSDSISRGCILGNRSRKRKTTTTRVWGALTRRYCIAWVIR